MRSFATGFKSIEVLLTDGPQAVYKMRNLGELLTSRRADLESRIKLVEQLRSVFRAIVIDEKEDFTRQNFSFSGIDGALLMLIYRLCSAAKMPATKLVGMSPGGLNATGESDHRFWNNTVAASQRTNVAPVLTRIAEVLLATKRKKVESISVEFESLWTLSPKEEAEVKKTTADTDAILIDKGIKTPEEIYLDRFSARGWRPGYSTTPEARELREFIVQSDAKKVKEGDGGLNKELLTPTAKEAIVTVNEAREAEGLGPDADSEIGEMKVAEYRAMQEAAAEVSGEAEAKEEHGIDPNPQPSGGNLPGQGPSESEGAAGKPGDKVPGSDPPAGQRNPGLPAGAPSNRRKPRA
jgi:hypothetical protein